MGQRRTAAEQRGAEDAGALSAEERAWAKRETDRTLEQPGREPTRRGTGRSRYTRNGGRTDVHGTLPQRNPGQPERLELAQPTRTRPGPARNQRARPQGLGRQPGRREREGHYSPGSRERGTESGEPVRPQDDDGKSGPVRPAGRRKAGLLESDNRNRRAAAANGWQYGTTECERQGGTQQAEGDEAMPGAGLERKSDQRPDQPPEPGNGHKTAPRGTDRGPPSAGATDVAVAFGPRSSGSQTRPAGEQARDRAARQCLDEAKRRSGETRTKRPRERRYRSEERETLQSPACAGQPCKRPTGCGISGTINGAASDADACGGT